jgi:AAA+ ATPase superfamily predicted ATPase
MKEYSPFTPGVPVPLEFFVGRAAELQEIIAHAGKCVSQSSLERVFVSGDRGIGKSSLCRMAITISEEKYSFLGLHVFLGGVNSLEEMGRRVFERLLQKSRDRGWFNSVKDFLGDHVKKVGLFGISLEFTASTEDLRRSMSDFAYVLRNLLDKIKSEKKGLILALDDLNGLAGSPEFANWLKSFVDEASTAESPIPLLLILAGLPERRRQLITNQPSLDRVFDLVQINRFSVEEATEFFTRMFLKVNVSVEPEALRLLCRFSGGHPVFMHEIGDSAFKIDTDDKIDKQDALKGILSAAQAIGAKYIEPKVLDTIRSDRYRGILKKIVKEPFEHQFSKKDLTQRISTDEEKVLHNFLQKMKKLQVIAQPAGAQPGQYEFTSELYALFFWLQASTEKNA